MGSENKSTLHSEKSDFVEKLYKRSFGSGFFLFILIASSNLLIWVSTVLYLRFAERSYTSGLIVSLPGAGSTTEVGLPNIGSASYDNWSPYAGAAYDPREDYRVIAQSSDVIQQTALMLEMSPEEFGTPEVRPRDNTTLIEFSFSGSSPEEAQLKATAFYNIFQDKLSTLRQQDIESRERDFQASLENSRKNVQDAEFALSRYQAESGLNSDEQITRLASNIEDLRKELAIIESESSEALARSKDLSSTLGLSTSRADYIFMLQADEVFQRAYLDYKEASADVVKLSAEFTPEYIGVVEAKAKQNAAREFLTLRGRSLLGASLSWGEIERIALSGTNGSTQEVFLQDLIRVDTDGRGLSARSNELRNQINLLEQKLSSLVNKKITLNALQRELVIAEAVFSSTLAKADIARSNLYLSYPPIQLLSEPSLPSAPSSPKTKLALAASLLASFFVTTGLIIFWIYESKTLSSRLSHENP